jgi:hypothetical protein
VVRVVALVAVRDLSGRWLLRARNVGSALLFGKAGQADWEPEYEDDSG